jgi:O-succinylbenzoate synthase
VLDAADVLRVDLPFIDPIGTAVGTHRNRPLVLVRLRARRPDGTTVEGWGESAALADTTYDQEDAASTYTALVGDMVPTLAEASDRRGALPSVGDLADLVGDRAGAFAFSTVEMAVADAHLRAERRSFAGLLGVEHRRVAPGAVVGLPGSADELIARFDGLRSAGFVRVKVKVAPGVEAIVARAARSSVGTGLLVQVDANGAYGDDAAERLAELDSAGLVCIEQPLGRYDLEGHRRLAEVLETPICLDESLDSPRSVIEAVDSGACSIVCVKPARLGGIGAALEVVGWCAHHRVPWWIGGMFESGYARGVNRALAALPGGALPGDLAPPSTYLSSDLVPAVEGTRDPATGTLSLGVPEGPGMGPVPGPGRPGSPAARRTSVRVGAT